MNETIYFNLPHNAPADILAEAEIHFPSESLLAGLKLVGFSIRRTKHTDGEGPSRSEFYVTFPARAFGTGAERRYFDFLRSVDAMNTQEGKRAINKLKYQVVDEYKKWKAKQVAPQPDVEDDGVPF